ncbi:unnamed protein product [marine sediment metagenome]|uniref:Uncharacterized protein n=1 Tax=marine sediment metagenome TaxID=412755 RepID=X1AU12_9ZZZZ
MIKHTINLFRFCLKYEMGSKGGGGGDPVVRKKPVRVKYKKEKPRTDAKKGKKKRPLGAQFMQSRKPTGGSAGFGGQKEQLG